MFERVRWAPPSPYTSLQSLAPAMNLIAPAELAARAAAVEFEVEESSAISSPGGKLFAAQIFRSQGDAENGREEIQGKEEAGQEESAGR